MSRFLIVDDETICRERIKAMLSAYGKCDEARDGTEALELFRKALDENERYDLICLDILMPDQDGHEVLAAIRETENQRQVFGSDGVKVIMTTALTDSKHCMRAFGEGCEAYVTKPVDRDKLRGEVQSLVGELTQLSGSTTSSALGTEATSRRFLIVDDDRVCRELLRDLVAPYGQCDVAHDGQEAIEAVRLSLEDASPYDVVFLDIMMPGINGHDALQSIREVEAEFGVGGSDSVNVMMTTALNESRHCITAFREGCECYLTKPIDERQLFTQMESLLGPLVRQAAEAVAEESAASRSETSPDESPSRRFLIVDDDRVCRELLKDYLQRYGTCDVAYDGQEAIDAIRFALEDGNPYDLVCLDIMMPGTDGHDALVSIRRVESEFGIGGLDGVKVVMTTALDDSKHCVTAFREGCEIYITKPVKEDELFSALAQLDVLEKCPT